MINFSSEKSRLLQLSFLLLFVELALIRWTGANLYFFSFYSNFVLLASFLGIGIGFLRAPARKKIFHFSPLFLFLLVLFCSHYHYQYQVKLDPVTDDLNYFGMFFKENIFPVWITLPIIFIAVAGVMAAIADGVSRSFRQFLPLQAYRLDIVGSLLGIIVFSFLSFLHASPVWWGVIISVLFISLLKANWKIRSFQTWLQAISLLCLIMTFALPTSINEYWSPYYKINVHPFAGNRYVVNVNGAPQQIIESVEQRHRTKPFYFLPYQYRVKSDLEHVLVVGAGTGGDVAIALAQGAKQVDAVEIDPLIYQLGRKLNPNHPYQDARVRVFIGDGRAFLQQHHDLYDMIIFALPDSIMLISGQSSLRLENYLYTLEGFTAVLNHLKPDGMFTVYNYYRDRWLVDRVAAMMTSVFKHTPCLNTYGEQNHFFSVFTIGKSESALACNMKWLPVNAASARPNTDNHPFLYLKENRVTGSYLTVLFFIFVTSLLALKISGSTLRSIKNDRELFLMGSAFLLLETKNITNFALLFGTTWFVNALVFIGILFTIYLSIEVANQFPKLRVSLLYGALLLSLLIAWFVPSQYLLSLSFPMRFLVATVIAFSPIFIANLIFAMRFREITHSAEAFGINLIGAVLGGLLEYISLIVGYQNLLILIALLYLMAMVSMRYKENSPSGLKAR